MVIYLNIDVFYVEWVIFIKDGCLYYEIYCGEES